MKKTLFCIFFTLTAIAAMYSGGRLYVISSSYNAETVLPERKGLMDYVTVRGKITEKSRVNVIADTSFRVVECFVSAGDEVSCGDVLMTVEITDETVSASVVYDEVKRAVESFLNNGDGTDEASEAEAEMIYVYDGVFELLSPCGGTVMNAASEKNAFVPRGKACAVISDLNDLEITATLEETYISSVEAGNECIIRVPALGDTEFSGKLETVMPYARTSFSVSGSSRVETELKISVTGKKEILKPGYSAVVKVVTDRRENAVVVPFDAIGEDENCREYVLCLKDKKAVKTYIVTGKELLDKCEVISGLTGSESLILRPEKVPERCIADK